MLFSVMAQLRRPPPHRTKTYSPEKQKWECTITGIHSQSILIIYNYSQLRIYRSRISEYLSGTDTHCLAYAVESANLRYS